MFEKIRNLKNKKGFTLVELIVVLVILAILAALLVPALTGYIDKANKEKVISETRMVVMAAQTEVDLAYGAKTSSSADGTYSGVTLAAADFTADPTASTATDNVKLAASIKSLSEVKGTITSVVADSNGKVTTVVYTNSGKTCTYDASKTDPYSVS